MTNGDAIYYIKQLAVLSTEKEMPKIEEALNTAIKSLSEDYAKGFQSGYKAKEYDRESDCEGCKFIGLRYIEGATPRCEGCCRNYADGYVAEQTEPQTEDLQDWKDRMWAEAVIKPQTERVETMSCQECKHYEVGKPCKPFLNELDCHYEPQTDKGVSYSDHTDYKEPKTYVTWTEPQTDCSWK